MAFYKHSRIPLGMSRQFFGEYIVFLLLLAFVFTIFTASPFAKKSWYDIFSGFSDVN